MLTLRRSGDRGHADHGWLDTRHTFSFADYQDPAWTRFRSLRVLNEDRVKPDHGFGTHAHREMEIVTLVVSGTLAHEDSTGGRGKLTRGGVQAMTAGTGLTHSEFNPSTDEPVHFLQIWLLPEANGIQPGYEQQHFAPKQMQNQLRLIGSRDGRDGSITIHQDVNLYAAKLASGQQLNYSSEGNRATWLQIARGSIDLNGQPLTAGDGAAITDSEALLRITGTSGDAELLLFDMAA